MMSVLAGYDSDDILFNLRTCILGGYIVDISQYLRPGDLIACARGARQASLIPQKILDDLLMVDPSIPYETRCRYLMLYIGKSVIANEKIGWANKLIQLLTKFLNIKELHDCVLKSVEELNGKLKRMEVCEMCMKPEIEMRVESHLNGLYEILSNCRHLWEKIGLALEFRYDDLKNIEREHKYDISLCLHKLLHAWLSLEHLYVKPPTFKTLEEVLSSKLVGLRGIVDEVKEQLRITIAPNNMKTYNIQVEGNLLTYSSCDITVSEPSNISVVLIEVRVKCQDPINIKYEWSKDGNSLKPSDSMILSDSILCIRIANICVEGKYQCVCKLGDEMMESNPIEVKVKTLMCRYRQRLIARYNIEPEVKQDTWHPVQQDTYINLAVIGDKGVRLSDKCYQQTIRGDADDEFSSKASIQYQEAFRDIEYGNRVFVVGRPGSGKTTLVHKISKDWAKGLVLRKHKALFLVYLRGFHNNPNVSLKDLVKCYFKKQEDVSRICEYIEEHEGLGVCFILDGLDEYQPEGEASNFIFQLIKGEELSCATVIVASRPAAVAMFYKVSIKRRIEVLGFFKEQIEEFIKSYYFSSDSQRSSLSEYLSHHPNIYHMCYLPIQSVILCFLFDECGGDLPNTETGIYVEFTKHILLRALYRSKDSHYRLQSLEDLEGTEMSILLDVCKLAYEMTISSIQVIQQEKAEKFFTTRKIEKSLGLITVDEKATNCGFQNLYSFFHLTFQEFLAAYHISRLEVQEQLAIIKSYGPKKHMYMVFKFYCGLAQFKEKDIRFKTLIEVAEFNRLHIVQCCFESQQPHTCDLVADNNIIRIGVDFHTPSDYACLGYVVMNARHNPVRIIECFDNVAELECAAAFVKATGNAGITHLPIEMWVSLNPWDSTGHNLHMMHMMHVSPSVLLVDTNDWNDLINITDSISNRTQSKIELIAVHNGFILKDWAEFIEKLKKNYKNVRIVSLPEYIEDYSHHFPIVSSIYCSPASSFANTAFHRAEILLISYHLKCQLTCCCYCIPDNHANCLCTYLSLFNCNVNDERAALLVEGLKHNSSVEVLQLVANDIGDEGAIAIASGITRDSHLHYLDLSLNKIGDEGAKALVDSGRTSNGNTLLMFGNLISNSLIAELDSENSIKLFHTLSFPYNIKQEGLLRIIFLMNEWSLPLSSIKELDVFRLASLSIDEDDIVILFKMLSKFTCLFLVSLVDINFSTNSMKLLSYSLVWNHVHVLNLGHNSIGPEGTTYLCQALQGISHQILSLNLEHNNIGVEGALAVAECLQVSQSLCELDLSYNDIQDTGTVAICESLKHGDKLQVLNLASNCIRVIGCFSIAILLEQNGKCLISLDLSCNKLNNIGLVRLARGLRYCSSLQKLNLNTNGNGDIGVEAVAEVLKNIDLMELFLENNVINNEGAKALACGLQTCNKLTTLNLSNNVIGDVGAGSLGEGLSHCSRLHTLKLNDNSISGSGAISLAEGVQHCHDLNTLELGDNYVLEWDLEFLAMTLKDCTELERLYVPSKLLDLYKNPAYRKIDDFRDYLPKCSVFGTIESW